MLAGGERPYRRDDLHTAGQPVCLPLAPARLRLLELALNELEGAHPGGGWGWGVGYHAAGCSSPSWLSWPAWGALCWPCCSRAFLLPDVESTSPSRQLSLHPSSAC